LTEANASNLSSAFSSNTPCIRFPAKGEDPAQPQALSFASRVLAAAAVGAGEDIL
jgi:hypothetical protein